MLLELFLASGCFASVRIEHGGGTAAWILRTLVVPSLYLGDRDGAKSVCILGTLAVLSVQGHQLHQPQELWPYQRIFLASDSWKSEGLFD